MPEFTANQLDAIDYRKQDACVIAGPGSGKTTVLAERYRSLIENHGFAPRNILAITFTEKAAANMKAKLTDLFAHDQLRLRELESAYVSTIHGFCARVLRDNAIAAGVDPRFSVLDARESEELQYACLNGALDELVATRRADALELIPALHKPDLAADLRNAYDGIRSAGETIAEVRTMPNPGEPLDLLEIAARLRGIVSSWQGRLTSARLEQRSELLEWVQGLEIADPASPDFFRLIRRFPKNTSRVSEISEFKECLPALIAAALDRSTVRFREMIFDVLARFEELYSQRKLASSSLDFNDLERRTLELLRNDDEIRDGIRAQFSQVMLDEFQDINEQQADLIAFVRGADVFFAVGDINQSIYGFRHARPQIFQDYRSQIRDSRKHSTELVHNFRSRNDILRCVETLLNGADGIDPRELIAAAAFPPKAQPSIEILKVQDDDKEEASGKEARWISHRILSLRATLQIGNSGHTRPPGFRDFAILCRNSDSMTAILEALNNTNIPYVCGRRQSFLLSRECLDIAALLHSIANPRDAISLATVLRSPLVGIGDEALLRTRMLANSLPAGLNLLACDASKTAEFDPEDAGKLLCFAANLRRWRASQPVTPLELLLVRALSDCGFQWVPGTVAAGNVENFLQLARTRGDVHGLTAFLQDIESLKKATSLESDLSDADQGDAVQVMTAHSAKGLEFPITIIAAMDKGTQRNSAPATFTPQFGLGLKWNDPGGKPQNSGLDDSWQLRNAEHLKEREKQEAHRLLYVAMTRAEEHLILSYSRGKTRPSNWAKIVEEIFQIDGRQTFEEHARAKAVKKMIAEYRAIHPHLTEAAAHEAIMAIPGMSEASQSDDSGKFPAGMAVRDSALCASEDAQTKTIAAPNGDSYNVSIRVTGSEPPAHRSTAGALPDADGLITVPRPIIEDQHDSAVNVTSLTVFADCPRKYYLQRYLGWNGRFPSKFDPEDFSESPEAEDETSDPGAADLGSSVHEILAGKPGSYPAEAQRLADVFHQSALGKRAGAAGRSEREWDFIADIHGTLVRGSIDLWFEEDGEIIIVDYKTDKDRRAESYAPQLALYALAIEKAFGRLPREAWLHFLRSNTPVAVPLDDASIDRVARLLAELAHDQDTLTFDLREAEHCRRCQFHHNLCPSSFA